MIRGGWIYFYRWIGLSGGMFWVGRVGWVRFIGGGGGWGWVMVYFGGWGWMDVFYGWLWVGGVGWGYILCGLWWVDIFMVGGRGWIFFMGR